MSSGVTIKSGVLQILYPSTVIPPQLRDSGSPPPSHSLLQHLTWRPTWPADQPANLESAKQPGGPVLPWWQRRIFAPAATHRFFSVSYDYRFQDGSSRSWESGTCRSRWVWQFSRRRRRARCERQGHDERRSAAPRIPARRWSKTQTQNDTQLLLPIYLL